MNTDTTTDPQALFRFDLADEFAAPALEKISIANASHYTEGDFRELAQKGRSIESLTLDFCPSTIPPNVIVELFSTLQIAQTLIVSGNLPLNDDCLQALFDQARSLEELSLESCEHVSLDKLKQLANLTTLDQVLFSLCPEHYVEPLLQEFSTRGITVTVNGRSA